MLKLYLGVIIDDRLKWSSHIESVEQKLQRLIGILYKIRLPNWCLCNIYFAFDHPNILYGLEVYGNASYLDKLTALNNKILRILQKKVAVVMIVCIGSMTPSLHASSLITKF